MTTWPRWEVFVRARRGLAHQHAGPVPAADGEAMTAKWHSMHVGGCVLHP